MSFRTRKRNCVLFIAAGKKDYLILSLKNGRIFIQIEMGGGETTFISNPQIKLNDLQWQDVSLSRSKTDVHLTISKVQTANFVTKGEFYKLDIDKGVFLGNTIHHMPSVTTGSYRGCFRNIIFNDVEILRESNRSSHSLIGINWKCSTELFADNQSPISFMKNTSYLALPYNANRKTLKLNFVLKTRSENAIVFYMAEKTHYKLGDLAVLELK